MSNVSYINEREMNKFDILPNDGQRTSPAEGSIELYYLQHHNNEVYKLVITKVHLFHSRKEVAILIFCQQKFIPMGFLFFTTFNHQH